MVSLYASSIVLQLLILTNISCSIIMCLLQFEDRLLTASVASDF
jgi:hypothetical protein